MSGRGRHLEIQNKMWPTLYRGIRNWAKRLAVTRALDGSTEITIETHQIVRIRRRQFGTGWCRLCGRQVDMVGLGEAMKIAGLPQDTLIESTAARKWHICEEGDGDLLICMESLKRSL